MATQLTVEEQVRELIVEQGCVDPEEITTDSTMESLGFDSLDVLEFQMGVEEKFNITLAFEEDFECGTTVQQILGLIDRLK